MKKKVLLVKCLNSERRDIYAFRQVPLGIAYLAAAIKDFCDLEIFDMLVDDGLFEKIRRDHPDIIGFSIFSVDFISAEKMIRVIRKISPRSLIIAGGAHATVEAIETLRAGDDLVVRGEGELALRAIVNALNGGQLEKGKIPGISYFDPNQVGGACHNPAICEEDIDSFPMPAIDVFDMVRKIVGKTLPSDAEMGTIRGDFSVDDATAANHDKRAIHNLVHASETSEEAEKELGLWFAIEDVYDYKRVEEDLMF